VTIDARRFAIWFLGAEALGAALWWCLLIAWPASRAPFIAEGAPESTLFAFAVADGALFVGAAAASAVGISRGRRWAWPALCIHAGAAAYAAPYSWTLCALTGGDGLLGAAMMTPSLVVPGILVRLLRPGIAGA
jgi:hypothetical protein